MGHVPDPIIKPDPTPSPPGPTPSPTPSPGPSPFTDPVLVAMFTEYNQDSQSVGAAGVQVG
jgi:hypothetical protein